MAITVVTKEDVRTLRKEALGLRGGKHPADKLPTAQHLGMYKGAGLIAVASWGLDTRLPGREVPRAARLWALAVESNDLHDHRRQGFGSEMVNAVVERAQRFGSPMLWGTARLEAVPFFVEELGWEIDAAETAFMNTASRQLNQTVWREL